MPTPTGIATASASRNAYPAISSVAGNRSPITFETGRPELIDTPNRPPDRLPR